MKDYTNKDIKNWDDFLTLTRDKYNNDGKTKWIFRGHVPGKPLESSLDRAVKYYPPYLGKKSKVEDLLLREFKRRYHQYSSNAPQEKDYLEWWSIMQHYGAPTRLLDFTYSVYVAAHFALQHTDGDGDCYEVFAINSIWAIKQSVKKFRNSKNPRAARNFIWKMIDNTDQDLKNFEKYFKKNSKNFVCPFNPFRLAERLSLQRGVFMCPGNVDITFEENLKNLEGWEEGSNISRLKLRFKKNKDEIIKARACLHDLNITNTTLFPGLGGFAESLAMYPPKFLNQSNG